MLARADGGGSELKGLHEGLKMTETILMQTLKKHGLERFDPVEEGAMFDPRLHEATFQTKVEGKEDGEVFMTQQKGFSLNGRILRVRERYLPSSPFDFEFSFPERGMRANCSSLNQAAKVGIVKNS